MSDGPEFFQTPMGRRFYERTVPDIATALLRIAGCLEVPVPGETVRTCPACGWQAPSRPRSKAAPTSTRDDFLAELAAVLRKYDVGVRTSAATAFESTDAVIRCSLADLAAALSNQAPSS